MDIVRELESFGIEVQVHDPLASAADARHEYGLTITELDELRPADAVILAVAHSGYVEGGWRIIERLLADGSGLVFDVKMNLTAARSPTASSCGGYKAGPVIP